MKSIKSDKTNENASEILRKNKKRTLFGFKPILRIGKCYFSSFAIILIIWLIPVITVLIILTARSNRADLSDSNTIAASPEPVVTALFTAPIVTLDDYIEYMQGIGVDLEFTDIDYDDDNELSPNHVGYEATLFSEFLSFNIIVDTSASSRIVSVIIIADISMISDERTDIIKIIEQITVQTVELLTNATFEEIDPVITDLIEQSAYAMNDTSGSINNMDADPVYFRGYKIQSNYYGSDLGTAPYVFCISSDYE